MNIDVNKYPDSYYIVLPAKFHDSEVKFDQTMIFQYYSHLTYHFWYVECEYREKRMLFIK